MLWAGESLGICFDHPLFSLPCNTTLAEFNGFLSTGQTLYRHRSPTYSECLLDRFGQALTITHVEVEAVEADIDVVAEILI